MTEIRIWHHGLDQYHAAYRMVRILHYYQNDGKLEDAHFPVSKLKVLDMFLAYPSLLHRLSYTRDSRKELQEFQIPKPDDNFVSLPPNQSLFRSMETIQKNALYDLVGKGILHKESYMQGHARLIARKLSENLSISIKGANNDQRKFLAFLAAQLGSLDVNGPKNIFRVARVHRGFR